MDENSCTIVAETDGEIIGFVNGQVLHRTDYLPSNVGIISAIYVIDEFRSLHVIFL